MSQPVIIGFGGTTRAGSSSERLVRAVLSSCEAEGAQTRLFDGQFLAKLPLFAPESPDRTPEQRALVDAVRGCDGLVIGTPAYHAGVSGLVKNALDLLEDLRGGPRVYFDDLPVGLVVSAAGWQGTGITLSALRDMVHAMRGWPTPIGVSANSLAGPLFDAEGAVAEPPLAAAIKGQARQIVRFANAFQQAEATRGAA